MFSSIALQYYRKDFPEIDDKCATLYNKLIVYNDKLRVHNLRATIGFKDVEWISFYKKNDIKAIDW